MSDEDLEKIMIKADSDYEKMKDTIHEQHEEINRLNNIINELEKWLEEQKHFIIKTPAFTKQLAKEHKIMFNDYENVLIKIEELKEENK